MNTFRRIAELKSYEIYVKILKKTKISCKLAQYFIEHLKFLYKKKIEDSRRNKCLCWNNEHYRLTYIEKSYNCLHKKVHDKFLTLKTVLSFFLLQIQALREIQRLRNPFSDKFSLLYFLRSFHYFSLTVLPNRKRRVSLR